MGCDGARGPWLCRSAQQCIFGASQWAGFYGFERHAPIGVSCLFLERADDNWRVACPVGAFSFSLFFVSKKGLC